MRRRVQLDFAKTCVNCCSLTVTVQSLKWRVWSAHLCICLSLCPMCYHFKEFFFCNRDTSVPLNCSVPTIHTCKDTSANCLILKMKYPCWFEILKGGTLQHVSWAILAVLLIKYLSEYCQVPSLCVCVHSISIIWPRLLQCNRVYIHLMIPFRSHIALKMPQSE